jgi:hypothetical protein
VGLTGRDTLMSSRHSVPDTVKQRFEEIVGLIVDTELWDVEDLDSMEPAHVTLKPRGHGRLGLLAIEAELDYRVVQRDGLPAVEFSFEGSDEGDRISGRGWAALNGEQLRGRLFFNQGDDSGFTARRSERTARRRSR